MADCRRKKFIAIWEAKAWMRDNSSPFPTPENIFRCHNCGQYHVTDNPVSRGKRRRRGKR